MERTTLASRGTRAAGISSSGRRRRRLVAGLLLLGLAIPAVSTLGSKAGAAPTPNRDIWSYGVFGWNSVAIKGQGATINGNVGVNNGIVNMCQNGTLTMGTGSQLVAGNMRISTLCTLYDVFWGNRPAALDKIKHHFDGPFAGIIDPTNVPAFPTNNCNPAKKLTVANGDAKLPTGGPLPYPLPPGVYGDAIVKDGNPFNKLALGHGTYVFCNVTIGKSAWFDMEPDTTVIVQGTFSISNGSALGHGPQLKYGGIGDTGNALIFVRGDADVTRGFSCSLVGGLYGLPGVPGANCATGAHVNLSKHTEIHATMFAPNGQLNLGHDTDLFGRFWALNIISDVGTRITVPACFAACTSTTTTTSTSTTTVKPTTSTSSTSTTSTSSTSTSTTSTTKPPSTSTSTSTTTIPEQ